MLELGRLLHSALTRSPGGNARHLKSKHPFVPAAQLVVHLTTTEVRLFGRITDGMRSCWRALRDSVLLSLTSAHTLLEWLFQEQHGSGLTAIALVSYVSAPAYANGVWLLLRIVSAAQRNGSLTMLIFAVQSMDLPKQHMAWRFWMTRQSNGFSKPAPRSGLQNLVQTMKKKNERMN